MGKSKAHNCATQRRNGPGRLLSGSPHCFASQSGSLVTSQNVCHDVCSSFASVPIAPAFARCAHADRCSSSQVEVKWRMSQNDKRHHKRHYVYLQEALDVDQHFCRM